MRLVNITGSGTTLSSFSYTLDPVGNRMRVIEADGTRVTWLYDKTYQLTREQRGGANSYFVTYAYDPAGNRLTMRDSGQPTTYVYDTANQLHSTADNTGLTTYSFDANGNQATVMAPGDSRTTYSWDYENRLTKVLLSSGTRNTFQYDADGKRFQKQDSTGTTRFVWDEENVLQETDQNNTTQVTYTLEPEQNGHLLSQRRGDLSSFFHFDGIGSTDGLTNLAGAVTDTYLFASFGQMLSSSGGTINPYKYIGSLGYYFNPDMLDYYVRARLLRSSAR